MGKASATFGSASETNMYLCARRLMEACLHYLLQQALHKTRQLNKANTLGIIAHFTDIKPTMAWVERAECGPGMVRALKFPKHIVDTLGYMRPIFGQKGFDISSDESWMAVAFAFQKLIHVFLIPQHSAILRLECTFSNPLASHNTHADGVCVLPNDTIIFFSAIRTCLFHFTRQGTLLRQICQPATSPPAANIINVTQSGGRLLVCAEQYHFSGYHLIYDLEKDGWATVDESSYSLEAQLAKNGTCAVFTMRDRGTVFNPQSRLYLWNLDTPQILLFLAEFSQDSIFPTPFCIWQEDWAIVLTRSRAGQDLLWQCANLCSGNIKDGFHVQLSHKDKVNVCAKTNLYVMLTRGYTEEKDVDLDLYVYAPTKS